MRRLKPDPDFLFSPWRLNYILDFKSDEGIFIGKHFVFINEQTGTMGIRMEIEGSQNPILAWEDHFIFKIFENSQSVCRYVIYWESGEQKKVRVKNLYPARITRSVFGGMLNYAFYFELATAGEVAVHIIIRT